MWKGDPIIRARLHRRDDGDDPKLAFRDAFPPATLHCVLQVEEDTGEQAALRDVGADGLPLAMTGLWERWKDWGTGIRARHSLYHNRAQRALSPHS
jgi:hypothetical protein